jgi:hypothetical protein
LQEILRVEEYIGNNTKQNKITINDNTWPIWGYGILCEVKCEDDNIHKSLGVWGLRYQICGTRLWGYEDFKKPYQRWGRLIVFCTWLCQTHKHIFISSSKIKLPYLKNNPTVSLQTSKLSLSTCILGAHQQTAHSFRFSKSQIFSWSGWELGASNDFSTCKAAGSNLGFGTYVL